MAGGTFGIMQIWHAENSTGKWGKNGKSGAPDHGFWVIDWKI